MTYSIFSLKFWCCWRSWCWTFLALAIAFPFCYWVAMKIVNYQNNARDRSQIYVLAAWDRCNHNGAAFVFLKKAFEEHAGTARREIETIAHFDGPDVDLDFNNLPNEIPSVGFGLFPEPDQIKLKR